MGLLLLSSAHCYIQGHLQVLQNFWLSLRAYLKLIWTILFLVTRRSLSTFGSGQTLLAWQTMMGMEREQGKAEGSNRFGHSDLQPLETDRMGSRHCVMDSSVDPQPVSGTPISAVSLASPRSLAVCQHYLGNRLKTAEGWTLACGQ
jgi:hypothetical protein